MPSTKTVGGCRLADQGSAYDAHCPGKKTTTLISVRLARKAAQKRTFPNRRFVPQVAVSNRSKLHCYSITSCIGCPVNSYLLRLTLDGAASGPR